MRLVKIPAKTTPKPKKRRIVSKALLLLIPLLLIANTVRPLPESQIEILPMAKASDLQDIVKPAWPSNGTQAAIGAQGFGLLDTDGEQVPIATASIAKVITALCVLKKHPLKPGEKGPVIKLTEADYALYQSQIVGNGSNLPIYIGQEISLYTAIQALMIPSANNIADTLAVWAFGSMENYHAFANTYVKNLGMTFTTVSGDASGYDPSTKSTAQDLVKLGLEALKNPVLLEIANQKEAFFPGAGMVQNYNKSLGRSGIDGLKTGNNLENPGGLLFTQKINISGKNIKIVGVVLGAKDLPEALDYSAVLAESIPKTFKTYQTGQNVVGKVKTVWGSTANIKESSKRNIVYYGENQLVRKSSIENNPNVSSGVPIGSLLYSSGNIEAKTDIVVTKSAPGPSLWWRASRTSW